MAGLTNSNNRQRNSLNSVSGTLALKVANIENVIFVNVETVPEVPEYKYLSADMQRLWGATTAQQQAQSGKSPEELYAMAGEHAEFGRVDCISVGVIRHRENASDPYFIMQSYAEDDERDILERFATLVDREFPEGSSGRFLCGHGIRKNGLPFFARRVLINRLQLPRTFEQAGHRTLTSALMDTADFWAFTDLTSPRIGAELLAQVFGIETSAADYDATVGAQLFHDAHDLAAVRSRSERKLATAMQLMRRFRGEEIILGEHIISK